MSKHLCKAPESDACVMGGCSRLDHGWKCACGMIGNGKKPAHAEEDAREEHHGKAVLADVSAHTARVRSVPHRRKLSSI
jgi:hypothetical protein